MAIVFGKDKETNDREVSGKIKTIQPRGARGNSPPECGVCRTTPLSGPPSPSGKVNTTYLLRKGKIGKPAFGPEKQSSHIFQEKRPSRVFFCGWILTLPFIPPFVLADCPWGSGRVCIFCFVSGAGGSWRMWGRF